MALIADAEAGGAARGPGRPKEMDPADRRKAVLDAALSVFSTRGFRVATMDDIAHAAGMSKKTIYALFQSKTELFQEILKRSRLDMRMEGLCCPIGMSAEERLVRCLQLIADVAFSKQQLDVVRLVVGEATQTPELAELFSREIMDPAPFGIPECLAAAEREGGFELGDRIAASEMLVGMVFGKTHFKSLLSDGNQPSREALETRIRTAVRLFLAGAAACSSVRLAHV